tara:strand:- start:382 stop:603 length:222 start_codon:yes stop_codon:yes gene_type:complete
MNNSNFICVDIINATGNITKQYFNTEHIVRVYDKDGSIYIETSDYCSYKTTKQHLDSFMDRFIKIKPDNLLKG